MIDPDYASLMKELGGLRYTDMRVTEELDKAGVEKYDNDERSDSTDGSAGSEWSSQYRVIKLVARARHAEAEVERLDRENRQLLQDERVAVHEPCSLCQQRAEKAEAQLAVAKESLTELSTLETQGVAFEVVGRHATTMARDALAQIEKMANGS